MSKILDFKKKIKKKKEDDFHERMEEIRKALSRINALILDLKNNYRN